VAPRDFCGVSLGGAFGIARQYSGEMTARQSWICSDISGKIHFSDPCCAAISLDLLKRFKHLCYYLGSTLFCLMLSGVPLSYFINGLDGSVSFGKGGQTLYAENATGFIWTMFLYLAATIWAWGASIYWFYVAWWHTPADRLP
jgi:hypothetical protein